ncbi:NAD(P)/FAD-dependent oxidoreductase [Bosea lathyri]|uniref:Glycine/D-amino acid oxidase n=1 Tax=Bosea lathyri TaxID=1036778 RepID=A0A1H5T5D6_9HYPH|nr:FAD-dependent oxidoreductase [Bosea lathyri]SEF57974.1 Glycine/D-amino acid oxidase [Bosea lathyri]
MPNQQKRRVAIVGAGIIGASIAYHLVQRDIDVCVVERGPGPASGTTGNAFGWVNTLFVDPSDQEVLALRRAATAEYERLAEQLPSAFQYMRRGSLLWKSEPDETESLVEVLRKEGLDVELIARAEFVRREPLIRNVPVCALASPKDMALQPPALASALMAAAVERGAKFFANSRVTSLHTSNGAVTGLIIGGETVEFDLVVLAAGAWTEELLRPLGLSLGLLVSPALLLRYSSDRQLLSHIIKSPELEIRQLPDNMMLVAKSLKDPLPDTSAIDGMGLEMLMRIRELVSGSERIEFEDGVIGHRPVFSDNLPRTGYADGCKGLYFAVGHPGVILAPLLGRLAASEIVDGIPPSGFEHADGSHLRRSYAAT